MFAALYLVEILSLYRIHYGQGLILFNSIKGGERYWITYQAASQGGRAMYDQISQSDFDDVIKKRKKAEELYKAIKPRYLSHSDEMAKELKYDLIEALETHTKK